MADEHPERKHCLEVAIAVVLFLALTIAATWPLVLHPTHAIYGKFDHVSTDVFGVVSQLARGIWVQGVNSYHHGHAPFARPAFLEHSIPQAIIWTIMIVTITGINFEFCRLCGAGEDSWWSVYLVLALGPFLGMIYAMGCWLDWREAIAKAREI